MRRSQPQFEPRTPDLQVGPTYDRSHGLKIAPTYERSIVLLDSARAPGAKILVSGGTRCNVTNREVTERDFWGGRPAIIRRVLRAFDAASAAKFFEDLGVPLHEEAGGKLFPDSGRARDVLNALLKACADAGVELRTGHRMTGVTRTEHGFAVTTSERALNARRLVLATGGCSLPKSGSNGFGIECARNLGHNIVPTTPALAPLLLDPADAIHRSLSGVSHDAALTVWLDGRVSTRLRGSLLWTHFGISGPVALNASRHWLRGVLDGRRVHVTMNALPDETFESMEAWLTAATSSRPTAALATILASRLPVSFVDTFLAQAGLDRTRTLAHLARDERRTLVRLLVEWTLPINGSRGYNFAEATAGGVALEEIDPATMESRVCQGLYLIGEMLDVDGRIGGFNFQWAWSSAYVAARALSTAD